MSILSLVACGAVGDEESSAQNRFSDPIAETRLDSLQDLSIESLRARPYSSHPEWLANLPDIELPTQAVNANQMLQSSASAATMSDQRTGQAASALLAYSSDGLRLYTRIDVPVAPPPVDGYPVLIYVHGWVGREAAPEYDFMAGPASQSSQLIKAYIDAGFMVLSPALRGHGTVNGVPAEGIEFLDAWDNASYLSPIFYAIDVLNLLAGIPNLQSMTWPGSGAQPHVRIDQSSVHILGHSQGADAALTALAVSGEGSSLSPALSSGSIWSGCFGPRLEQAAIYGPMASSLQAFMSGDGSWTGSAIGRDGSTNADFVFAYPPDWIATVDTNSPEWTWQADSWSVPTVAMALDDKFSEMYATINAAVADMDDASFELQLDEQGKTMVLHDPRIMQAMSHIGGYDKPQYLTEAIQFHYSDQDYYSPPAWNESMTARINSAGGKATAFVYPQNNHSLRISQYPWFSHGEVREGFPMMLRRDIALFLNGGGASNSASVLENHSGQASFPQDQLSIPALRQYAAELHNEFEVVRELEPLNGMARRELAFTADGLQQFALLIQPPGEIPAGGWPVLLMNHGYHPSPADYGRIADGTTDRPGDYYRSIPLLFAARGFLVVVPDYRGHNDSQGAEYTTGELAPYWYARDVIAAFRSLDSLPEANGEQRFLWGHSMGGPITLRALLALGDEVTAASIWSTGSAWLQSRNSQDAAEWRRELERELAELTFPFSLELTDPGPSLVDLHVPIQIHHAKEDGTTPSENSRAISEALESAGPAHELFLYQGADHLFTAQDLSQAVERDVLFFRAQFTRP